MSGATPPPTDGVTVTIDGRQLTVPEGTLLIRAAEQMGVVIPRFCDHPLLDPAGACRQCIVDVEGQRKPMTACTTQCTEGMIVRTQHTSEVARDAQEGIIEFLLINHPLDCPMCDKGGECPLQDQALAHGPGESRFVDQKRRYEKPVAVSEQILLDRERCVLCARCTRFAEQISGDPFIELFERGALQQVAIYEDEPYRSYFSGNVIQICPVGALTSKTYRFRARPFDLRSAPTVCNHCSSGCVMTVHQRRGDVLRQLARTNMDVNEMWTCDKGRFGFAYLKAEHRLLQPMLRGADAVESAGTTWAAALGTVRDAIVASRERGPGRVAVLTGGRLHDEDAYALAKLTRTVFGSDDIDFRTHFAAPDEDESIAAAITRSDVDYDAVEQAPLVVAVGLDTEEEVPILHLRLRKSWRRRNQRIVTIAARSGSLARYAWRHLATAPGDEAATLSALAPQVLDGPRRQPADAAETAALAAVAAALAEAGAGAVILVGERAAASPGALAAAGRLAEAFGAKVAWVPRRAGDRGSAEAGCAAGSLPGGRRLDDDADRAEVAAVWGSLPSSPGRSLRGVLEAAAGGEIDVLYLAGVDLVADADAPDLVDRALARVPLVVAQDVLRTETVARSHVALPVLATQERGGSYSDWEGRRQPTAAAVAGPPLARADWEVFVHLSALLGSDLGFRDLDGISREMARLPRRAPRPWPATSVADPAARPAADGLQLLTYPLLLDRGAMLTGARDLLATARSPFVALNPVDAAALGVAQGDLVELRGAGDVAIRLPLRLEDDLVAGWVFVPRNSTRARPSTLLTDGAGYVSVGPAVERELATSVRGVGGGA